MSVIPALAQVKIFACCQDEEIYVVSVGYANEMEIHNKLTNKISKVPHRIISIFGKFSDEIKFDKLLIHWFNENREENVHKIYFQSPIQEQWFSLPVALKTIFYEELYFFLKWLNLRSVYIDFNE